MTAEEFFRMFGMSIDELPEKKIKIIVDKLKKYDIISIGIIIKHGRVPQIG